MADSKTLNNSKKRSPIVVIMGHVDHGKTTLLDYIRKANVAAREAGGITQAVGAYEIIHNDRRMTFIDTPGHQAFKTMRSRGATAADIAVLVVAADEGVKPQTKEAIQIILDSKTPFIVAINKIDKTEGNIERAKTDLANAGVLLEGFGGQISYHAISAKTGEGVDELIDLIFLAADLEDLSYDPAAPASGYVLEVKHDPRRGMESTVILKNGTLRRGAQIYTPTTKGKARILENFLGKSVEMLEPSAPAIIVGFEKTPQVGEVFSTENIFKEEMARKGLAKITNVPGKPPSQALRLILKAADAGSLEALGHVIRGIDTKNQKLEIISEAVGDITDGDVKDAIATSAILIGFKNKVEKAAIVLADAKVVRIITSNIVYDLEKAVQDFLAEKLGPAALGELEILAVFNQDKPDKQLVGGKVVVGTVRSKAPFDLLRKTTDGEEKLTGGKILNLREKKSEINEAEKGKEIGLLVNFPGLIKAGDKLIIKGK